MTSLIKIKKTLSKTIVGRIIIQIYHYLLAIPMVKIYSCKFHLIKKNFKHIKFHSLENTLEMMKNEKKSLCRFGDGEISWIHRDSKGYFNQENSKELSERLREILLSEEDNILIGVPDFFGSVKHFSQRRIESRNAHLAKYYKRWMELLDHRRLYSDSLITRVYNGLKDGNFEYVFNSWKSIWENKNLIIIEGAQTRFGVGNDLLNKAHSVKRIIAPAENAFQRYNEIFSASKKYMADDSLFLISLGPTATVLAYDIGMCGSQALDIGHLDIEYEWYISRTTKKIPITGKYVNEAGGAPRTELSESVLKKYTSEITEYIL